MVYMLSEAIYDVFKNNAYAKRLLSTIIAQNKTREHET